MTSNFTPLQHITNLLKFRMPSWPPRSSTWPVHRRSAVLVLLFIGTRGELRVLLTKRSRGLSSFSGHVSLPGGKADNESETFEEIARREAEEEIGLPLNNEVLLKTYGLKLDNISSELPHYLSHTFLSVKPLVCFLYSAQSTEEEKFVKPLSMSKAFTKLNPGETSSVFSIPLRDMIVHKLSDPKPKPEYLSCKEYQYTWGGLKWPVRHHYYANDNDGEVPWLSNVGDLSSDDDITVEETPCKDVWGLTATILYDVGIIAEGMVTCENTQALFAHELLIYGLYEFGGQLREAKRSEWEAGMIKNKLSLKYSDVLPEFFITKLKSCIDDSQTYKHTDS
ncbi:8-oxo-dGTP diphosphatase Ecym_4209 [Eremothecium cymbalariae DBVPG|uniref:Nudix hydrolase domain-containing protein n=1 Tax=Eremothecium cymbalariae (strain CBS 270.75 / DBVPG 7215 / KCTC 17166 / NRRL Y-17582) TaxID=931890 RepID=G8JTC3_ERECY|nr:hypothetical protein Ecym_4209 [Eremothecium cymbalariae DBVPG\